MPLALLSAWSLLGPPSVEAACFTVGVFLATAGAFRRDEAARRRWLAVGLGIAGLVLLVRCGSGAAGEAVTNGSEPGSRSGRWLDRLVPERDLALGGSRLLGVLGLMPPDEPGLLDHLRDGYDRMRADEGAVPSPVLGNLLLGQTPDDHGVLRVRADARDEATDARAGLVFLHGFMGSTTLSCWQVAQAAKVRGIATVCPAMDWRARWDTPGGRTIARRAVAELREGGAERVYLAGLSAGAIGASRIARDLDVDGVILISGASRRPRPARVPTLVLQGARDRMTPPALARAYVERLDSGVVRYIELPDAGHWLVLSHHEQLTEAIGAFFDECADPP